MLRWWAAPETHNASSYFSRNPASAWVFYDYARHAAKHDQVTTAMQAHLNWTSTLTSLRDSEWAPRCVFEHCEVLLSQEEDLTLLDNLFTSQAELRITQATQEASQATLNSVESSICIRNEAREAAAASRKRKQPTGDEAANTAKSRTRSSLSWQQYARKPWKTSNRLIFNMALSSDRDKINAEALRFLMDVESRRQLDHDELEDMEEPLNTFRHVHSLEMLHTLLEEMYGKMQGRNYIDRRSCELRYIWTNFDTLRDLWARTTMSTKWKESWFLAHLHVPVLGILRTIVDTEYKMADIKGMAAALTNIDLRNDAILHHISLALDLVVMEAKPSSQAAGMFKDLVKLEKCMTANLESAIAKLPKGHTDKIPDLRSHAILCSGFDINFLEASLVKDHVVIYAVGKVTIPKSVGSSYELAQSLKSILSFKRRVEANADLLLQARSTRPDFPTSEGSSSRFVVV
ncbi:hypothetical protein B0O80DRAFT_22954 [Mortierella sp. GBAus27b]|nr:hypothetical protein B0O80DRAFT_22954 [Mortierella sp. GBAus27b]